MSPAHCVDEDGARSFATAHAKRKLIGRGRRVSG